MASNVSRGNYYKNRTRDWFTERGYAVQLTEFLTARPVGQGKIIYVKKDVFGADGIAMNGEEIIFWNAKSSVDKQRPGRGMWGGRREFAKYPFPPCVKLQVFIWEPRKRPVIVEVNH